VPIRVAYLVNQYPAVSHTFVRREIEALERRDAEVVRISIRPMSAGAMPDPRDRAELTKTKALLQHGAAGLVPALEQTMRKHPVRFARALELTTKTGMRSERGLLRNYAYLAEACALRELCEREAVQHVHAHFGTNSAAVAMLCRELGGPSYSFTAHGPEEFDKPDLIHLRAKIERSAFVVGVSSFGRSQLYRHCDLAHWSKVKVVRCGVDDAFLAREPAPVPSAKRLVCVGRLCEQKGQLLLVEAAAQLAREGLDFELVLVGDGPMRKEVEALADKEGVRERVRITGWASGDVVRSEIEGARALVLPSFAEGLPVVIMEALALGRPVITTYIAGIPELVADGICGYLVPAGSRSDTANAMRKVLEAEPKTLTKLGLEGRARVREMHDAQTNADVLLGHFKAAIAG
jgi:glycosyltransferase involved in cell wall biosynthesis